MEVENGDGDKVLNNMNTYCNNCNNCNYCDYCYNCNNCDYCYNCNYCDYCYNCNNQSNKQLMAFDIQFTEQEYNELMSKIYNIRMQSPFILTPSQIKEKLGIGFKVISMEVEKDQVLPEIKDTVSAFDAIIKTGYRALARANHPDLGGDAEVMTILNRAKKEIEALLKEVI